MYLLFYVFCVLNIMTTVSEISLETSEFYTFWSREIWKMHLTHLHLKLYLTHVCATPIVPR